LALRTLCGIFSRFNHPAQQFRGLDAHGANQDRLGPRVAFLDLVDDGVVFFAARLVDAIVRVFARDRPVGRNDVDVQLVNVVNSAASVSARNRHAGKFV